MLSIILIGIGFILMMISKNSKHRMILLIIALVFAMIGVIMPFLKI